MGATGQPGDGGAYPANFSPATVRRVQLLAATINVPVALSGAFSYLESQLDVPTGLEVSDATAPLATWTADDSKKLNVAVEVSGSLVVGAVLVAPPAIYGS